MWEGCWDSLAQGGSRGRWPSLTAVEALLLLLVYMKTLAFAESVAGAGNSLTGFPSPILPKGELHPFYLCFFTSQWFPGYQSCSCFLRNERTSSYYKMELSFLCLMGCLHFEAIFFSFILVLKYSFWNYSEVGVYSSFEEISSHPLLLAQDLESQDSSPIGWKWHSQESCHLSLPAHLPNFFSFSISASLESHWSGESFCKFRAWDFWVAALSPGLFAVA